MNTDWIRLTNELLKHFLTKVNANWMHDYWSKNTSNDIFHTSVSVIELEFQPIGFSRLPLFYHFYPKIDAKAHFNSLLSNVEWFNRKPKNTVRFSIIIIRISIIFMHLRSELFSEISQKIGDLDWKTEKNHLKVPILPLFIQKYPVINKKRKTLIDFLL